MSDVRFELHLDGVNWVFAPWLAPDMVPLRDFVSVVMVLEALALGEDYRAAVTALDHGLLQKYFQTEDEELASHNLGVVEKDNTIDTSG